MCSIISRQIDDPKMLLGSTCALKLSGTLQIYNEGCSQQYTIQKNQLTHWRLASFATNHFKFAFLWRLYLHCNLQWTETMASQVRCTWGWKGPGTHTQKKHCRQHSNPRYHGEIGQLRKRKGFCGSSGEATWELCSARSIHELNSYCFWAP